MSEEKQNTERNLDDLTVTGDEQDQIKGGPKPKTKRTIVLQNLTPDESNALSDLEPAEDVSGGIGMLLPAVQKVRESAAR